jgi:type IV fimbrial biogenesis protein FimT
MNERPKGNPLLPPERNRLKRMKSGTPRGGRSIAHAGEHGFSLVELLTTLAVIVTLAAISVPMISNAMASYRLKSAVATVTGAIQSTRYQAIYQGYSYQVVFDPTAKTFQVQSKPLTAASFSNVGSAAFWAESAQQVTLNAATTLTFSPGGKVTLNNGAAACPCTMTLTYPGKTPEVITVSSYGNINVTP